MKRQIANNLKRFSIMFCALIISALALSGCSTLTYVGEDYSAANVAPVQTDEMFYFSTYNKISKEEDMALRIGISKTPVNDVLVMYIQVANKSNTDDYVFYTKDLKITAASQEVAIISPSNYMGAYQNSQAGAIASMTASTGALGGIATIANSYQQLNQSSSTMQTATNDNTDNAFKQISNVVNGISAHTINNAAVIEPGKNRFFYIFINDPKTYPIQIDYKDLSYSFMVKGNASRDFDDED